MKQEESNILGSVNGIEWTNLLFIVLSPLIAIGGTVWLILHGGPAWPTWILFAVMLGLTGLGITAGYHRLFSHKTYKASWVARLFLLLLGGAAFEGSAREWCCAHRKHHRFVDRDGDPYNIKRGFWWAHVGWVVIKTDQSDESGIHDLLKDRLVLFQDKHYIPLAILVSFAFPTALAALWGDFLGGIFVAGFLRLVVNHHLTFLINSWCHFFGRQNYSDYDSSRDSFLMAFFTYGEGYHNFHHTFANDYRNGIRAYHFDPGKWLIRLLAWMGLASDLKMARPQKILTARLQMQEKQVRHRVPYREVLNEEWASLVVKARENVERLHDRLVELKEESMRLKREKMVSVMGRLDSIRTEIERLKGELNEAMLQWQSILKGQVPIPA